VVSAPGGPCPSSISACLTHARKAVSVRSNSLAICPTLRPSTLQRRTASALNSFVNFRRFRFSMDRSRRILAPFGLSTEAGEAQLADLCATEAISYSMSTRSQQRGKRTPSTMAARGSGRSAGPPSMRAARFRRRRPPCSARGVAQGHAHGVCPTRPGAPAVDTSLGDLVDREVDNSS
jgi:hypothetical protein